MCNLYIVYYTLLGMYISDLNIQYSDLVYIQTFTYFIYRFFFFFFFCAMMHLTVNKR